MNVCIHFVENWFDVSSGTIDSLHQWNELLCCFGVENLFVINQTNIKWSVGSGRYSVSEYKTLDEFLVETNLDAIFVEQGSGCHYKKHSYSKDQCYLFGGYKNLPRSDVSIPTGKPCLYQMQAVSIILSEATWQLH